MAYGVFIVPSDSPAVGAGRRSVAFGLVLSLHALAFVLMLANIHVGAVGTSRYFAPKTLVRHARLFPLKGGALPLNIEEAFYAWIPEPWEGFERQVPVNRFIFLDAS
jgi:hypothetical protein